MLKTKLVLGLSLIFIVILPSRAGVLPPDAIVDGRTIGEWSAECWKWIYSIRTNENPLLDCVGTWATNRQPNPKVFLIAPVWGVDPPPCPRTFTIREGRHLLVPVFGITYDNINTWPPASVEEMLDVLNSVLDVPDELHAFIDGVAVPNLINYRATSPPFGFYLPDADNELSLFYQQPIVGLVDPVVADGYWLMLEPLPVGQHLLRTGGQLAGFFYAHEVICNITVEPVPLRERVDELSSLVEDSSLSRIHLGPLLASLQAAIKSFERDHAGAGIAQLRAFQNKVRHQITRIDHDLANQFIQAAQQIIERAERGAG